MNAKDERRPLESYYALAYRFNVIADQEGGYVVEYPDLPGCMTQVETTDEIVPMAEEARRLWLRTAYELDIPIPEPGYPESYSGKFNVRLPRSLHRQLAERAEEEDVSLNQLVVSLLSESLADRTIATRIDALAEEVRQLRGAPARSNLAIVSSTGH